MEIKIQKKKYTLKYTLRALLIFERITGKPFSITTITDQTIFFYCLILANNETDMTFEQFIEAVDNDSSITEQCKQFVENEQKKQKMFQSDEIEADKKKV